MKTLTNKTKRENKGCRTILKVTGFSIVFLFTTSVSMAQMNANALPVSMATETYYEEIPVMDQKATIIEMNVMLENKKTHITWTVKNQRKNGTYLIERSEDGDYFTIEGLEKGIPTKRKKTASFHFVNNDIPDGIVYYRVRHIANDNSILLSKKVSVENSGSKLTTE